MPSDDERPGPLDSPGQGPTPHPREQPGLRLRLAHEARRIVAQHEYLGALEQATLRALERSSPPEAREALNGFGGALDAHFALEEQVHFPALHGLRPDLTGEIEGLIAAHERLRTAVVEIDVRIGRAPRDEITRAFRTLAEAIRGHEADEERLLASSATSRES